MLDPDEPRYLAIGRAMARTGDYVTPRLWGAPWFEKPPLLYWLTSLGASAGLGPELSGRLPIALLSLCFLATMFFLLRREFGIEAAAVSSVLLATCAGWIAYSSLALTDLPLAVFYSLALFLALAVPRIPLDAQNKRAIYFALIGACLGFAALAKGPLPIVLAIPLLWFLRRSWRSWGWAAAAIAAVAMPWYLVVYLRNGVVFLREFFWRHNVERLYSATLQHVQPWWYYIPILLAAIFPWTPLLALFHLRHRHWDERKTLLASCFGLGFLLFSASVNKLPGYLLPLLPAAFALFGATVDWRRVLESSRWWLLPSALLIGTVPMLAHMLPELLGAGRVSVPTGWHLARTDVFYILAPLAAVLLARRTWVGVLLVLCLVSGGLFLKIVSFPLLEKSVSARGVWRVIEHSSGSICDGGLNRNWALGLAFYRGAPLPLCQSGKFDMTLQPRGRGVPSLEQNTH